MRNYRPHIIAGVILAAVAVVILWAASHSSVQERGASPGIVLGVARSSPAPARAEPSLPLKASPITVEVVRLMTAAGGLPQVEARESHMTHHEGTSIAGWRLRLVSLRTEPAARRVDLSAPNGVSIDAQALGGAAMLCDLSAGAATARLYELTARPGIFMAWTQIPEPVGRRVQLFNAAYLRATAGDRPPAFDAERRCLARLGKL